MNERSQSQRAATDIGVQMVGRVLNILLGVVAVVLLTRELGTEGFGEWATITAILAMVGYVGELGLEPAAVRRAATADEAGRAEIFGSLLALRLTTAVPTVIASIVAIVLLSTSPAMTATGIIAAFTNISAALMSLRVTFQVRVRNTVPIVVLTINSLVWTAAIVGLSLGHLDTLVAFGTALLCANLATAVLMTVLACRASPLRFANMRRHARDLLRVGAVVGLGQLLTYSYVRIDQVLVLRYTDAVQAGLYGAAYQLLDRAQFLPAVVLTTLLPLLAASHATDPERLRRIVSRAFDLLALVTFPVFAFAATAAEPFMELLFGPDFRDAAPALPILMAAFVLTGFGFLLGNLALVVGTQNQFIGIAALALVVNVLLNVLLLPRFGYLAAAWITLATEVLVCALSVPISLGRIGMRPRAGRLLRLGIAATVMAGVVLALRAVGADVVVLLVAAPVAYAAAALAVRGVDLQELRSLVRRGA